MTALAGRHSAGHRRRRHHRLHDRRPAPRRRASRSVVVLDNLVRGRAGQPRRTRWPTAGSTLVDGDIRDRDLVHDLTAGMDLVFHQAAIRITQCAEEPRLALEVLVDGTFNVVEAAAEAQGRQGRRRLVARRSTAWPRSSRPPSATTPTTTTRSTARPRPSTRACCAASGP